MATILEESENTEGDRIATIKTDRGEEYRVNVDKAVCAVMEALSNLDNEERFGWALEPRWFRGEIAAIRSAAIVKS